MSKPVSPYKHFPSFVLRTPVLSFLFYKELTAENTICNEVLKEAFADPLVKESCFLASPTLYFELEKWLNDQHDPKKEQKIRFSLLKYLTRMSTRCTPFGLFAGCCLGHFAETTEIATSLPDQNKRHTRLDMNYLVAFSQDLAKNERIRNHLLYYPNTSIYSSGDQIRYIEYYYVESRRQHHIVEVDNSKYLQVILDKASSGTYLEDVVVLLQKDGIPRKEAEGFISELLQSQLLVSELEPSVSGPEFMNQISSVLKKLNNTQKDIRFLKVIDEQLNDIDKAIGNMPKKYIDLSESLKNYSTSFELKYLFQTDLELRPKQNKLSLTVVESVKRGMLLLNKLTTKQSESHLSKFKEAFFERYEEREMPLSKVLDVETGIGYIQDQGSGDINPLVDDLVLPSIDDPYQSTKVSQNKIHAILEEKLVTCNRDGVQKIVLTDNDFKDFPINWSDLPDTLSALISVVDDDSTEKITFSGMGGSSASNLLGRFCHGDKALNDFTQGITDFEKEMNSDKVLAEIVHLPEARVGNILMRPSLRDYEIPYLAKSSLPFAQQISLEDLFISVRDDRIVLRSKQHDKEVLPRLANAHNFSANALPIYQFLCDMQTNGLRGGLYFSFGFLENNRSFIPRVEYRNLILHKAKWKVKNKDVKALQDNSENTERIKKEIFEFRNRFRLPRYVLLVDGDNELLINLENVTSVQMLLDTVKNRPEFLLSEFLFANEGIVNSDSGYHTHQIVVSFFNDRKRQSKKGK